MFLFNSIKHAATSISLCGKALSHGVYQNFNRQNLLTSFVKTCSPAVRYSSNYNPYPNYQETPDPFKTKQRTRYGYKYKYYTGGVLPRPKGKFEDIPLRAPRVFASERDQWTQKKALFGQNDYIDILGDGDVHPVQLMTAPVWLQGFRGNELQRLIRRMKFQGRMLKDQQPTKYLQISKRIKLLYKKFNRRRRSYFWSGSNPGKRNRRFNFATKTY